MKGLIKKRKRGLSKEEKKDWKRICYSKDQLTDLAAYNAIKNVLANDTRRLEGQLNEITRRFNARNNIFTRTPPGEAANHLKRELKNITNEWIECKTALLLNQYRSKYTHLFHPINNIKAVKKNIIRKNESIRANGVIVEEECKIEEEYYAYTINEEGKQVTKRVDPDFIRDKLDGDYLKYFDVHQKEKGWICFDQNDKLETQSTEL